LYNSRPGKRSRLTALKINSINTMPKWLDNTS
jgi:hypothetical protein